MLTRQCWISGGDVHVGGRAVSAEPLLGELICIQKVEWFTMDFRVRRQGLLESATQFEEEASRVKNAKAQDLMRALALLHREMAEELEDLALFESRFAFWTLPILPVAIEVNPATLAALFGHGGKRRDTS